MFNFEAIFWTCVVAGNSKMIMIHITKFCTGLIARTGDDKKYFCMRNPWCNQIPRRYFSPHWFGWFPFSIESENRPFYFNLAIVIMPLKKVKFLVVHHMVCMDPPCSCPSFSGSRAYGRLHWRGQYPYPHHILISYHSLEYIEKEEVNKNLMELKEGIFLYTLPGGSQ